MTIIIGIVGRKGSGKNTLATALPIEGPVRFFALADVVKEAIDQREYANLRNLSDYKLKDTYRKKMQKMGKELRAKDPLFIVNSVIEKIEEELAINLDNELTLNLTRTSAIIITDVRLVLEFETLKKKYPLMFFIHIARDNEDTTDLDCTEIGPDILKSRCDYAIINSSSIDALKEQAKEIMVNYECSCTV